MPSKVSFFAWELLLQNLYALAASRMVFIFGALYCMHSPWRFSVYFISWSHHFSVDELGLVSCDPCLPELISLLPRYLSVEMLDCLSIQWSSYFEGREVFSCLCHEIGGMVEIGNHFGWHTIFSIFLQSISVTECFGWCPTLCFFPIHCSCRFGVMDCHLVFCNISHD